MQGKVDNCILLQVIRMLQQSRFCLSYAKNLIMKGFREFKEFTKFYASVSLKIYFWHESSLKLFLFTPRMYLEGLTYHVNSWVVIRQRLLEQISSKTSKTHLKLNFRGSLGRGEIYQFHNNLSLSVTKSEFWG